MKKFFTLLLTLALLCTAASCGNDNEQSTETSASEDSLVSMETPEYDDLDWGEFVVE